MTINVIPRNLARDADRERAARAIEVRAAGLNRAKAAKLAKQYAWIYFKEPDADFYTPHSYPQTPGDIEVFRVHANSHADYAVA